MGDILIYSPQMAPYGGLEQHLCLFARELGRAGNRVVVVTTSNSLGGPMRDLLEEGHCRFLELSIPVGRATRIRKAVWLLKTAVELKRKSWDVIYTNGQGGLVRLVWLAGSNLSRVLHHHHTSADALEQKTWNASFLEALRAAPVLVANSEAAAENMQGRTGRRDVIVAPYITADLLPGGAADAGKIAAGDKVKLGFCGRLVSTKGLDIIAQLSLRPDLADIVWHIHGSGPDYDADYFKSFPNIIYHGPYSSTLEYRSILLNLDAVVLFTKHSEGRPLALTEAMAAGLPWVASDRGGTSELAVSAANCRLVSPDASLDDVAGQTRQLVDDIRNGVTNRQAQRAVYDRYFSPVLAIKQWLDLFGLPEPPAA